MAQAGGTHNIPSTYQLPEAGLTIGQAYINIRGAWDMLSKEKADLEKSLVTYPSFDDVSAQGDAQANYYGGNFQLYQ